MNSCAYFQDGPYQRLNVYKCPIIDQSTIFIVTYTVNRPSLENHVTISLVLQRKCSTIVA
jgi:hypothetical protein